MMKKRRVICCQFISVTDSSANQNTGIKNAEKGIRNNCMVERCNKVKIDQIIPSCQALLPGNFYY
jgi:hypothetical protein